LVSSRGTRSFSSPESRLAPRSTYPSIQREPGALTPGVNQLGNEADHSPLSIAEIKNEWRYTFTSAHAFALWCLIKYRDRCTYSRYYTKAVDIADDSMTMLKITNTLPITIFISSPRMSNVYHSPPSTNHRSPYFHISHRLWPL